MNLPLVTASSQLSHRRHRTGDHKMWGALSKHAISWMTLSSDCPLEANLWQSVVQSCAKVQPVFRSNRDYYTR
jgi:hypothetical protein